MSKVQKLENYLNISPNKFGIYLFDTINKKNLYKEELIISEINNSINHNLLKTFLDKHIYKIEKLSGKFIKNIFIILEYLVYQKEMVNHNNLIHLRLICHLIQLKMFFHYYSFLLRNLFF